jgi:AcrR family transcriptional regulator
VYSKTRAEPPKPLPRGRHGLSREDVRDSQRRRLIEAMFDQVAERGYPATTVGDVVSAARCSRNAFYELFEDKEACYIAASDEAGAEMLAALSSAAEREDS